MPKQLGSRQCLQVLWPKVSAVIFDVEGTLVDAVPLSLLCWQETLEDHGFAVSRSVLQCLSGMDGQDMLARIAPGLSRNGREQLIAAQGNSFKSRYLERVQPLRGAHILCVKSEMPAGRLASRQTVVAASLPITCEAPK
jgi:beta-phosphoglucomutase-like phosphatase (HAD superfamily)